MHLLWRNRCCVWTMYLCMDSVKFITSISTWCFCCVWVLLFFFYYYLGGGGETYNWDITVFDEKVRVSSWKASKQWLQGSLANPRRKIFQKVIDSYNSRFTAHSYMRTPPAFRYWSSWNFASLAVTPVSRGVSSGPSQVKFQVGEEVVCH